MLKSLSEVGVFLVSCFCFTMVNRPENLAEGAWTDRLLLVIWKEGSEQIMPTCSVMRGIQKDH